MVEGEVLGLGIRVVLCILSIWGILGLMFAGILVKGPSGHCDVSYGESIFYDRHEWSQFLVSPSS